MQSNSTNKDAGVAVVGMGYWGRNLVRNFYEIGALSAVCDSNTAVEATIQNDYKNVRFCRDFNLLLAEPDIRAVALATPAVSHFAMARAALNAGKDVFVEKPLAVDVQEGRELVQLAKAQGRILMVGHILRYHPAVVRLQQL